MTLMLERLTKACTNQELASCVSSRRRRGIDLRAVSVSADVLAQEFLDEGRRKDDLFKLVLDFAQNTSWTQVEAVIATICRHGWEV